MDSKTSGQSSSDLQRQAAAAIARKKVLAAYAESAKKAQKTSAANSAHMKDAPMASKIDSESWKRYHSAWQDYYQKYYSEYYSNAARNYIEKEKLKEARQKAEEEEILNSLTRSSAKLTEKDDFLIKNTPEQAADDSADNERATIGNILKAKIRKKAVEQAKKTRRGRKLIPILAGLAVVLLILFLQYNRLIFAPIMAYVSPGNMPASEIEAIDPTITQTVSPEPRLIIPKINVDVPVHFGIPLSDVMSAMNKGVAHYRIAGASAFPGQIGNLVITGHSAGDIYSSNQYKYIFSGLERLDNGDLIYVNYESKRYTYKVFRKEVVEPSNVAAITVDTDRPILTLITCTPLGTSRYRLLVFAEQISPSHESAKNEESLPTVDINDGGNDNILPSNEPSFFEGIWNWLTGN